MCENYMKIFDTADDDIQNQFTIDFDEISQYMCEMH